MGIKLNYFCKKIYAVVGYYNLFIDMRVLYQVYFIYEV
jgi:hypothetical protein